ncbi:MAG: aldehyde dehydrogenase family protein [Polyangiaceae bacterium]|nr:aldehyde dehydrogenase family protein [Polyangiaceae bacterium]
MNSELDATPAASLAVATQAELQTPAPTERRRLRVQKTYKMFAGGQFIRSESGRYFQVTDVSGATTGEAENIPLASRKDGRDAVKIAHGAWAGWSGKTAYNRGQILYRLGEVMEARAAELAHDLHRSLGLSGDLARAEVEASIDRVLSFAGWSDKFQALLCSSNPVAGPHFNFSVPEPMGVVATLAPRRPSLLGLVSAILPALVAGNTCVVLASEEDPRTALSFCECVATSDVPAGVLNVLTGKASEVAPHLARHQEVAALDLWTEDDALARQLEELAVGTVKRVRRRTPSTIDFSSSSLESLATIERFVEMKTVWHPVGV